MNEPKKRENKLLIVAILVGAVVLLAMPLFKSMFGIAETRWCNETGICMPSRSECIGTCSESSSYGCYTVVSGTDEEFTWCWTNLGRCEEKRGPWLTNEAIKSVSRCRWFGN